MKTIFLSWEEQNLLNNFCSSEEAVDDISLYNKIPFFKKKGKELFSKDNLSVISNFVNEDTNILKIVGLPIDQNLPKTPYMGYIQNSNVPISSVVQILILAIADIHPIAYNRENDGNLYRHVVPTMELAERASSHGSACTLDMHVSNPILPIIPESTNGVSGSPEFLSLYGVRQVSGVYTEVIELDDVLEIVPKDIIQKLEEKKYYFRMPSSFGDGGLKGPFPILVKGPENVYYNRTDMDTAIPKDYSSMKALSLFLEYTREVSTNRLLLAPGDMLLFKNQRTLHSRKKFIAQYNGLDRWMIRLYGTTRLDRHFSINTNKPYIGKTYVEVNG